MDEPEPGRPADDEAEAQREETVMPWIWGGIAILVIAVFVAWLAYAPAQKILRHPPAAAPLVRPPGRQP